METNSEKQNDIEAESSHDGNPVEITITLPTQIYFISGIRDFTLNLIRNMSSFNKQWSYRFQSIVDELCNNAIEHGSSSHNFITIIFQQTPEYIQILVSDHGGGDSDLKAKEIQKLVDEKRTQNITSIRGRGLPKIVAEWTDELEFNDNPGGGITVRVKKYINSLDLQSKNPDSTTATNTEFTQPTHIILNV